MPGLTFPGRGDRWPRWLLALCLAATACAAAAAPAPDFAALAARVAPAVVNIGTHSVPEAGRALNSGDDGRDPTLFAVASGIIISADGYILTSASAITGADDLVIRLGDGRRYTARVVGADRDSDLALLKAAATGLPSAKLGNSGVLQPGQWVAAIGLPAGLDNTVTVGVISALHRYLSDRPYIPYIQTDTPISIGSFGGPLLNLAGEVIGINSAIRAGSGGYTGVSYAVPSNLAADVVRQIKESGEVRRGWLGVNVGIVPPELARATGMSRPSGALVNGIADDGPAARAGLKTGDIIVGLAGQRVSGPTALPSLVGTIAAGRQTFMTVLRGGVRRQLGIRIGLLKHDTGMAQGSTAQPDRFGMVLRDLSDEQRQQLGITAGVMVESVADGGAAKRAGIASGDIVMRLKAARIPSVERLGVLEQRLERHELVPILVRHDNETRYVAVEVDQL